jgi:hypothetical protein
MDEKQKVYKRLMKETKKLYMNTRTVAMITTTMLTFHNKMLGNVTKKKSKQKITTKRDKT